jgi:hypothetical protein
MCCCVFLVFALTTLCASGALALDNSFTEDFTSKQFCDVSLTTALWDTTAGELKLHPFELTHVGSVITPGHAYGIAVAGDRAYVADAYGHLQVYDISDPTNPTWAASYTTRNTSRDVVVAGDWAYVADGSEGLCKVDIGTAGPGTSINFDTPGTAEGVVVAGDLAYVADGDSGLRVVDISKVYPAYVGNIPTLDYAWGIDVSGDYAYVAVDDSGLVVVDISNPASPTLVGHHDTPYWAFNVVVSGKYAFVADYGAGLQIVDISDPGNPTYAGHYNTDGAAVDVRVVGDHAFVADSYGGLVVIDVTDPANPSLVDKCVVNGLCWDVAVAGEYAYLAAYDYGLQVIDICDRMPFLVEMGTGDSPGNSYDVTVDGNYAYVADWYQGIDIFDISNPANPLEMGSFEVGGMIGGRARHVAVSGSYAYVAYDDSGLVVVDVSDPMNPTWAGSYVTGWDAHDIDIEGDYLYMAYGADYFQVLDITDPTNPTYVGSYNPAPGWVTGIDVHGDLAFAVDGSSGELLVLSVADPTNPNVIGTYPGMSGEPMEVAVDGDYAFVADYSAGVLAIDVSDPTSPVLLDNISTVAHPYDIVIDGDYAVVADQLGGVTILDISDPNNLVLLETLDIGICHGLTMAGDYIYAADQNPGLAVIKMYDRHFDIHRNVGRSLAINESIDPMLKARMTITGLPAVIWFVSGDQGVNWTNIVPDAGWFHVAYAGTTFHWHSIHVPIAAGVNPSCSNLLLEWLFEYAVIDSIVDIPNDQGGRVRIYFTRSAFDFAGADPPISMYNVWRRLDSPMLLETLRNARSSAGTALDPGLMMPLVLHEGRRFLLNEDQVVNSGFPPGTWEVLGGFAAIQQDKYIHPANTLADSSDAALPYAVYCISAHTYLPEIWYVGVPDSGYSIDNIAPAPPPNFRMESEYEVAWDMVPDEDFQYYTVYGTVSPDFEEDRQLIGHTIDLYMDMSGDIFDYYHVTATDYAGNEGYPSSLENTYAGVPPVEDLPVVFALGPNMPNPFSDRTEIRFDLPEPSRVSLKVFDAGGRLVRVLVESELPAGHHSESWSGRDQSGREMSSGVYFVKMRASEFEAVSKILLMR